MNARKLRGPPRSPILPEDSGTVSHVYFNGNALVDAKGNS